jgi:PAS domain S-box-containing protein
VPSFTQRAAPRSTPERVKILLVDDRPANLLAMGAALASPEYEVVKAQSGAEALRFLLTEGCALILMDVNMPDLDGYETARLIRANERTRDIPIVFVTGYGQNEHQELAGYESGGIDYLLKPVRPEVLRSKVAAFATLHRAKRQLLAQAEQLRDHERRAHALELAELELQSLRRDEAAQRRHRALVEGITHAIVWVLDPVSLTCSFVSPSAGALLGFEHDRWTREPSFWVERLPDDDRARVRAAVTGLSASGPGVTLQHRLVRADGRLAWFETELRLLPDEDTGKLELRGFSVDVTEAVRGRESLAFLARISAELSRSLDRRGVGLAAARGAVPFLADFCMVDLAANDGLAAETLVAHADPALEADAQAFASDPALRGLWTADGFAVLDPLELPEGGPEAAACAARLRARSAMALPLVSRGRPHGMIWLFAREHGRFGPAEVTIAGELARRAAQALENAVLYDDARSAVRIREEFISIASHELRTPLSALLLQTRLLEKQVASGRLSEGTDGRAEVQQRLGKTIQQVERLTTLVNSLLDLARMRSGRITLAPERCDLGEVVRDVNARFEELLARAGRAIEVSVEEGVTGLWDRGRLEQLLTNLVGNAVKYGGKGPIAVAAERRGQRVVITVSDRGPGIPVADQARIFERFERGGRRDGDGLGLGLYICRRIAEAHRGRIVLESAPGQGATFQVELPIEERDARPGEVPVAAQAIS